MQQQFYLPFSTKAFPVISVQWQLNILHDNEKERQNTNGWHDLQGEVIPHKVSHPRKYHISQGEDIIRGHPKMGSERRSYQLHYWNGNNVLIN